MFLNKFSDRANHGKIADTKNDAFSDFRDRTLGSIGVTKDIRDIAQPAIDYGLNQTLPKGGAVPDYDTGVFSDWVRTGNNVSFNASPLLIGGILIIAVAGYLILKGK